LNNLAGLLARNPARREEALRLAEKATTLAPGHPELEDTRGWILHLLGRSEEALQCLSAAVAAMPDQPTLRYHLACAQQALGNTTSAANHLRVAAMLHHSYFPEKAEAEALLLELTGGRTPPR
jgi:tetratricopeptide (TPR) repeat protein